MMARESTPYITIDLDHCVSSTRESGQRGVGEIYATSTVASSSILMSSALSDWLQIVQYKLPSIVAVLRQVQDASYILTSEFDVGPGDRAGGNKARRKID